MKAQPPHADMPNPPDQGSPIPPRKATSQAAGQVQRRTAPANKPMSDTRAIRAILSTIARLEEKMRDMETKVGEALASPQKGVVTPGPDGNPVRDEKQARRSLREEVDFMAEGVAWVATRVNTMADLFELQLHKDKREEGLTEARLEEMAERAAEKALAKALKKVNQAPGDSHWQDQDQDNGGDEDSEYYRMIRDDDPDTLPPAEVRRKEKCKERATAAPQPPTGEDTQSVTSDPMEWAEIVAETERIERAHELSAHTACQAKTQADAPNAAIFAPPGIGPRPKPTAMKPTGGQSRVALPRKGGQAPKSGGAALPPGPERHPRTRPGPGAAAPRPPPPPRPTSGAPGLGPAIPAQQLPPRVVSYAAAAKAATGLQTEWTAVQRGGKSRGKRPQHTKPEVPQPVVGLNMDQRKFVFITDTQAGKPTREYVMADIMSAVNRALHQEDVPTHIRMFQLRRNAKGTIAGLSTPFAPIEQLLGARDTVIRAARTVDLSIVDITANETWHRVKIHGVPLNRYLGKGTHGLEKLREELEAENEGLEIPMQIRWLGRVPVIRERAATDGIRGSSVTFVVRGQPMADRFIRSGARAAGKHYQVEAFVEARPDTICGICSGWGHGEHNCSFPNMPRCALCAQQHKTADHTCPVQGCRATKGSVCSHLMAKCPNCKGPHGARSDQCPKKKEVQEKAQGWRGKESTVQPAATPPGQRTMPRTSQAPCSTPPPPPSAAPEAMVRDDGVYESRWAIHGNSEEVQVSQASASRPPE